MPSNLCQRSAMAAAIVACFPAAAFGAGVARVDFASGNVAAISTDGRSRTLAKGSEIEVGETVSTQAGRAQLRFADGALMSLQPQTEFKVEEFKFSGKAEATDNIVMNLLKGGMRTITGLIGRNNRNAYRLKTDVATIGIRGTEYSVKYTNSIEVFVADGAVSVENQSGSFTVPGGSGVMVSNQQTPPQQTDQKPVLPPESPTQKAEEEQQQQVAEPVNPIQEASPPVVVQPLLTGTLSLHMAFGNYDTCQDACYNPVHYFDNQGTLDSSGTLVAFQDGPGGQTLVGTATATSDGNDGTIAWGRWTGGELAGTGELGGYNVMSSPLHYVVGMPATNIPTSGTATFTMMGATAPSFNGGFITSASVVSSTIGVDFATSSAMFSLDMRVNDLPVTVVNAPIDRSGAMLSGSVSWPQFSATGPYCSPALNLKGFLAGAGATRAGMAYHLEGCCAGEVAGVIAYKR